MRKLIMLPYYICHICGPAKIFIRAEPKQYPEMGTRNQEKSVYIRKQIMPIPLVSGRLRLPGLFPHIDHMTVFSGHLRQM